jgi:molybdopterin-guanine dinucleotide biosynthesis protein A
MRRDKALLPWGPTDLLGHALARLLALTDDVRILCGPHVRYADRGVPVEPDLLDDAGPLVGVLMGLQRAEGRTGLFLGVDLPFVPVALLARLAELVGDFDAAVPVPARGPQPLCAAYGRGCLEAVRRRVGAGELKMTAFWPDVRVREVGPGEVAAFGDPDLLFLNVNAPEDYERALALRERLTS